MAHWSMEPNGEWTPACDLELANWTTEPAAYTLSMPTVEYASSEIFGSYYQTSITVAHGEQLCGYEVARQYDPYQVPQQRYSQDTETENPHHELNRFANKCNKVFHDRKLKMHRYPTSIQALCLDERYTTPKVVAIGPYHNKCKRLKPAEKFKYVAFYNCVLESTNPPNPKLLYDNMVLEVDKARSCYDNDDLVSGISCQHFRDMMIIDACFLVQFMFLRADYDRSKHMDKSLVAFYDTNHNDIFHDIMLLKNQIPWPVVQKIINSLKMNEARKSKLLETFIYYFQDCLQDLKHQDKEGKEFQLYHRCNDYDPPHFLGLLRYCIVGRNKSDPKQPPEVDNTISFSVGAIELAQMVIKLEANKNCTELIRMGVKRKCIFRELFLAPVTLDDARASCLISMAAHELCINSNFQEYPEVKDEGSAVCSYLHLLAMLVAREDDVQKLRENHILLGAGLVDKEVLDFVAKLHELRLGNCYIRVMKEIENYRSKRRPWIKCYRIGYRNWNTIVQYVAFILGIIGIIVTIVLSLKKSRGNQLIYDANC